MKELLLKEKQRQELLKQMGYDVASSRKFILSRSGLISGSVLEIGTGKGHFTLALAKKGFKVTSIDLDPAPQKTARQYLRHNGLSKKARILTMDAEKLKFADESFDHIMSVNFMHHARRPMRCLREMFRVARSRIVIADINKRGAAILERVHRQEGHQHPHSKISFTAMREFFEKKGCQVKTYRGCCQTILVVEKGV